MPLYTLNCLDKADALSLRMSVRPDHLAYLDHHKHVVKLAGPFLDEGAGNPIGSLLIIDVADLAAAQAFAQADPYAKAGLFGTTTIQQFRATIGPLNP